MEIDIKKVKANPQNPRFIEDKKFDDLVKSIKEFPEMLALRPLVLDDDGMVLGGNMRLKACIAAGLKKVPVITATGLTQDEKDQFIIKDNTNYGEWDFEKLKEFGVDKLDHWGLEQHNFLDPEESKYQAPEYEQPIEIDVEPSEHQPSLTLLIDFSLSDYNRALDLVNEAKDNNVDLEQVLFSLFTYKLSEYEN